MQDKRKIPELLAPAGDLEKAKTAIRYGADAVYIGGQSFSLRSRASNFNLEQMKELVEFARNYQARVYVTVNMIMREESVEELKEYLLALDEIGIDAIIAASPGLIRLAASLHPSFEIHLSTQRTTLNAQTIRFYRNLGVSRVVLARENTLDQIEAIAGESDTELEVFIHGGMCVSYSGRCKLSNYMTGRDANRGGCAQSCRWSYTLYEDGKPLDTPVPFSMGSTDLNALRHIEKLSELGISSLKIEGRMKSAYYLATVVSVYRQLLDWIAQGIHPDETMLLQLQDEISKAEKREGADGFLGGFPGKEAQIYEERKKESPVLYVARVLEAEGREALLEVRNRFHLSDHLEVFGPDLRAQPLQILSLQTEEKKEVEGSNRPMQKLRAVLDREVAKDSMIRLIRQSDAVLEEKNEIK